MLREISSARLLWSSIVKCIQIAVIFITKLVSEQYVNFQNAFHVYTYTPSVKNVEWDAVWRCKTEWRKLLWPVWSGSLFTSSSLNTCIKGRLFPAFTYKLCIRVDKAKGWSTGFRAKPLCNHVWTSPIARHKNHAWSLCGRNLSRLRYGTKLTNVLLSKNDWQDDGCMMYSWEKFPPLTTESWLCDFCKKKNFSSAVTFKSSTLFRSVLFWWP